MKLKEKKINIRKILQIKSHTGLLIGNKNDVSNDVSKMLEKIIYFYVV